MLNSRDASALNSVAASWRRLRLTGRNAETPKEGSDERLLEPFAPVAKHLREDRRVRYDGQTSPELGEVPVDGLGLPAESVEPVMVEIGCGKFRLPIAA